MLERKKLGKFINTAVLVLFWFLVFFSLPSYCLGHGHEHSHNHDDRPSFKYSRAANEAASQKPVKQETDWNVWRDALAATLFISAAPFLILFFVPLDKSKEKQPLLKILLSFASGGLLGDAFLHLIPHALAPHSHDDDGHGHGHSHGTKEGHSHGDMGVGISVLLGIITFLLVEKGVRLVKGGHGHSHTSATSEPKTTKEKDDKNKGKKVGAEGKSTKEPKKEEEGAIAVAGYLNIAADFAHNLTDGLAIGASFLVGRQVGIITTLTILLHEIPHEIGDFAILVQSGCSKRKAMALQLVTAFGALLGTVLSLLAEGAGDLATSWILPFTAGGFIYISTVSIIPELLEDSKFVQSLKEVIAMLLGVFLMVLIADYE